MPETFQARVHALGTKSAADPSRGIRFCYGRENNTHEGVFLTWSQVAARVRGLGRTLLENGVSGRDVVLIHSHDQQTAFIGILACMHVGAIPAAVAPIAAGTATRLVDQFHNILGTAQPKLLLLDKALPAEHVDGRALPPALLVESLREADSCPPAATAGLNDACFLQFTSGSTSAPKGVVVTQRMLLHNFAAISDKIRWQDSSRLVGWLPIYHDMSLVGLYLTSLFHETRACFFPPTRFGRSPDLWLQLMAEERAGFSAGPNFSFAMINRHAARRPPAGIDLSCVRSIICGSEPISAEVLREFHRVHAHLGLKNAVMPAFGMAECTLMATSCEAREPVASIAVDRDALEQRATVSLSQSASSLELVGCGSPAGDMQVMIKADDGSDAGEICLSGTSVLSQYYRNPAATDATLIKVNGKTWLRTGDYGFLRDGQLYICGRMKDVIIHNGVNYFPADVEQALVRQLPQDARLAAVVDLRRDLADDFIGLGVLFEETTRDGVPAEKERRVAQLVKDYTGLPVAIAAALRNEHIPRTTSGKLVRHEIRNSLRALMGKRGTGQAESAG